MDSPKQAPDSEQIPGQIDTLIHPGWIVPIEGAEPVLIDHSLAISGNRIAAILPRAEAASLSPDQVLELPNHLLMPGLINTHGHAAMSLLRGYADDLPLMTWLQEHIWPAEQQWLSAEFVTAGSRLAVAEMLQSGTTCFSDMYFFPDATAKVASDAGMRAQLTFPVIDFTSAWASSPDDYITKGLQLRDDVKHNALISIAFGPHAPYTVSNAALEKVVMYAAELDMNIHIHAHETAQEVSDSLREHSVRPLERLADLGLLCPRTQLVHMTQLDSNDIKLVQESGSHVVHCPKSNLKLASGSCPVSELIEQSTNVCLGTDSAASNNGLNLFNELNLAALLAKGSTGNAATLEAHTALRMATLHGAEALGMAEQIGSLKTGKQADIIAIDMNRIATQPIYNPISQLVYSQAPTISYSWVAGKMLLNDGELTTLNKEQIIRDAQQWQAQISSKHTRR